MTTTKTAHWLIGSMIAVVMAGTFVYFDPPTPGRAFTKNQTSMQQQDQGSGANHKRTSSTFYW
jgi:hypothetical protein